MILGGLESGWYRLGRDPPRERTLYNFIPASAPCPCHACQENTDEGWNISLALERMRRHDRYRQSIGHDPGDEDRSAR